MELTRKERLALWNQYQILAALYPDEADTYRMRANVVANGYQGSYHELFEPIDEDEMDDAACAVIRDTLDMYGALQASATSAGVAAAEVEFPGYDGNNEGAQMGYARHLIEEEKRWKHVKAPHGLNSHFPMAGRYWRMLTVWQSYPVKERFSLNAAKIKEVLEAGR